MSAQTWKKKDYSPIFWKSIKWLQYEIDCISYGSFEVKSHHYEVFLKMINHSLYSIKFNDSIFHLFFSTVASSLFVAFVSRILVTLNLSIPRYPRFAVVHLIYGPWCLLPIPNFQREYFMFIFWSNAIDLWLIQRIDFAFSVHFYSFTLQQIMKSSTHFWCNCPNNSLAIVLKWRLALRAIFILRKCQLKRCFIGRVS